MENDTPYVPVAVCGLSDKRCAPCTGATPRLTQDQIRELLRQLPPWTLTQDATGIVREVKCRNFKSALALVNALGTIAEDENHHPDILIHKYKLVRLTLTTHAIQALSENDFIVAAKIDVIAAIFGVTPA